MLYNTVLNCCFYSAKCFSSYHRSNSLYLNVVRVGPIVPVPEQHVDPVDDTRHAQHHHNTYKYKFACREAQSINQHTVQYKN
jgi:hypothetical protein